MQSTVLRKAEDSGLGFFWQAGVTPYHNPLEMLDPATAFGIAINVLTFIDFSRKVISKMSALHRSPNGTLIEHREMLARADQLENLDKKLRESLSDASSGAALTRAELGLQDVLAECKVLAEGMQAAFSQFTAEPGQSKFKSFRQASKSVWSKEGLIDMYNRLQALQSQLLTHLLIVLKQDTPIFLCKLANQLQLA